MLTAIQRFVVVCAFGLATGWVGWSMHRGFAWYVTLVGAVLCLLPHAPMLAVEFVLLRLRGRDAGVPPLSVGQLLSAWFGEVFSALLVFGWLQPFRSARVSDVAGQRSATGVLLVPGFFCTRGLWATWQRRFAAEDRPCSVVSLTPPFGSIEGYAAIIDAAVRDLRRRTGVAPVVVGHSMGGLAVRAWLAMPCGDEGGDELADERVARVVTIGTPHQGTWLARFAFSANGRQMRQQSQFLQSLAASESAACRGKFVCFYSHADNIVFPASAATLPGADNRHLTGVAHLHMLFHPEVFSTVMGLLSHKAQSAGPSG